MTTQRPRLVLFSGLGVDEELFAPQRELAARVEVVPWLRPQQRENLRDYARRLAATINPDGPLYLGGVSFGAMLALEAAAILRPRGVFMIGGARSGQALAPIVKMSARLSRRLPDWTITTTLLASPLLVRMVGKPGRRDRDFLLRLAARGIPWLTGWGAGAILDWSAAADLPGCPVHHIHGEHDRMIPPTSLRPRPDVIVPRAGHVINVTHAQTVNAFIAQRLALG